MSQSAAGSVRVTAARELEEALQHIAAKPPDLVVVDLAVRHENGAQICRAIRLASESPILVLTALDSPAFLARLLDAGADDCLVRPVSPAVLAAHVKKLIRRTGPLQPTQREQAPGLADATPLLS